MVISVGGGVTAPDWDVDSVLPAVPLVACAVPPEASRAKTARELAALGNFIMVILCIPLSAAAEAFARCDTRSPARKFVVAQVRI
jgi:hypothetical protein